MFNSISVISGNLQKNPLMLEIYGNKPNISASPCKRNYDFRNGPRVPMVTNICKTFLIGHIVTLI